MRPRISREQFEEESERAINCVEGADVVDEDGVVRVSLAAECNFSEVVDQASDAIEMLYREVLALRNARDEARAEAVKHAVGGDRAALKTKWGIWP